MFCFKYHRDGDPTTRGLDTGQEPGHFLVVNKGPNPLFGDGAVGERAFLDPSGSIGPRGGFIERKLAKRGILLKKSADIIDAVRPRSRRYKRHTCILGEAVGGKRVLQVLEPGIEHRNSHQLKFRYVEEEFFFESSHHEAIFNDNERVRVARRQGATDFYRFLRQEARACICAVVSDDPPRRSDPAFCQCRHESV